MSQVSVCSATAHGRSAKHALRPLLVLGGFVAIWWALMTGVAQADSAPHHNLVDQVRTQVKAQHQSTPVRDVVRRVHHDVKTTTSKATPPVRHQAKTIVDSTPLATVTTQTTKATKTIRTTVTQTFSGTVSTTRALLANTAAAPVVDTLEGTVKNATGITESSTGQGNSHSPRHSGKASTNTLAELLSRTLGQQSETSAAPRQARASTDADAPLDGPRGTPPVHDPCASPSGSSSTSFTPVGITESSWLATPTVLRDLRTWRLARLPGGPAYQPGSAPD